MRHARTSTSLLLVAALGVACASDDTAELGRDEARELLENRNWLDRWPSTKDDRLRVYRFTPAMGGGVFQDRTLFRGEFELFNYELSGDRVRFRFPDADEVVTSHYRIERVRGKEPFDLRLTFEPSPRGPSVYFGTESETAGGALFLDGEASGRELGR